MAPINPSLDFLPLLPHPSLTKVSQYPPKFHRTSKGIYCVSCSTDIGLPTPLKPYIWAHVFWKADAQWLGSDITSHNSVVRCECAQSILLFSCAAFLSCILGLTACYAVMLKTTSWGLQITVYTKKPNSLQTSLLPSHFVLNRKLFVN